MLYDVYVCFDLGKRMPTTRIVERGAVRGKLTFDCPAVGSSRRCYATITGPDGRDLAEPMMPAHRQHLEDGNIVITGKEIFGDERLPRNRDRRPDQQWLCIPVPDA